MRKKDKIDATVDLLPPEELPGALRLLEVYERAGWISAVEEGPQTGFELRGRCLTGQYRM